MAGSVRTLAVVDLQPALCLAVSNVFRALGALLSAAHRKLRKRLGNGQGTRSSPPDDHLMTSDDGAVELVAPLEPNQAL